LVSDDRDAEEAKLWLENPMSRDHVDENLAVVNFSMQVRNFWIVVCCTSSKEGPYSTWNEVLRNSSVLAQSCTCKYAQWLWNNCER